MRYGVGSGTSRSLVFLNGMHVARANQSRGDETLELARAEECRPLDFRSKSKPFHIEGTDVFPEHHEYVRARSVYRGFEYDGGILYGHSYLLNSFSPHGEEGRFSRLALSAR